MNADHGKTYLHEILEQGVIRHFIDDPVLSYRIISNILHVLLSPVQRGIENCSGNTVDDWVLVALDSVETVK
jgi:hypothetical protein